MSDAMKRIEVKSKLFDTNFKENVDEHSPPMKDLKIITFYAGARAGLEEEARNCLLNHIDVIFKNDKTLFRSDYKDKPVMYNITIMCDNHLEIVLCPKGVNFSEEPGETPLCVRSTISSKDIMEMR